MVENDVYEDESCEVLPCVVETDNGFHTKLNVPNELFKVRLSLSKLN